MPAQTENYFDDAPIPAKAQGQSDSQDQDAKTAVLPKNFAPDAKPGDVLKLRVTGTGEDDVQVQMDGDEEVKEPEQAAPPQQAPPGGDMGGMMD